MYYPLWPWHLPIESPSHRPMGPIDLPIKVAPAGSPVSDFGILAGSFLYVEWWHCTNLDNSYLPGSGIHIDEPSLCWFLYRKKKNDGWIMLDIGCQWNKFCWFNWTGLKIRKSLGETTHIKESLNSIIPVTDSQESHLTTASTLPNSSYKCCQKVESYISIGLKYMWKTTVSRTSSNFPADFPHASSSVIQIQPATIR